MLSSPTEKKYLKKLFENIISPIDKIENTRVEMFNILLSMLSLLESNRLVEVAAETIKISELSDFMKKEIKVYITQIIRPIYETTAKLSFTFEDIEGSARA